MIRSKTLIPFALIVSLAAPTAAVAARADSLSANAAMRKGIRDYATFAVEPTAAKASNIRVDCRPVAQVGRKGRCTGTFTLTLEGQSAHYRLTSSARTLRISPGAIEYRVAARTTDHVKGLPASTGGFSGFLQ